MKKFQLMCLLLAAPFSAAKEAQNLEGRLDGIRISSILFNECELTIFVDELRRLSVPAKDIAVVSPVNFVLVANSKETFSMPLRDISLLELLQQGCRSFKVKAVFEPQAVLIVPLDHSFINPPTDGRDAKGQEPVWRRQYRAAVQFEGASIEDACEYLLGGVRNACDPPPDRPPFNLVLKSTPDASSRSLSIYARDISIHDALRYLAEPAGLELRYDAEAAVLCPPGDVFGQIEVLGASAVKQRADKIMLPQAEFMNATLEDVVSFVSLKSKAVDPAGKGVTIRVKPGLKAPKRCDLSLRGVSISEVLRYAAGLMEVKLVADDQGFMITEP